MNKILKYPSSLISGKDEGTNLGMKWSLKLISFEDQKYDLYDHFLISSSKPVTNYPEIEEDTTGNAIPGDWEERYDDFLLFRPGLRIKEDYFFRTGQYYTQSWELVGHQIFTPKRHFLILNYSNTRGFSNDELENLYKKF